VCTILLILVMSLRRFSPRQFRQMASATGWSTRAVAAPVATWQGQGSNQEQAKVLLTHSLTHSSAHQHRLTHTHTHTLTLVPDLDNTYKQ
jgi:hypothetical protein